MPEAQIQPLWFSGICDSVLRKVAAWLQFYERGEVCKDADYMERDMTVVKKPTMYAHKMAWAQAELEQLIRITSSLQPGSALSEEIVGLREVWRRGKMLSGGARIMTLAFYPEHVKQVLDLLLEARDGQARAPVDKVIQQQKEQGKELFEV